VVEIRLAIFLIIITQIYPPMVGGFLGCSELRWLPPHIFLKILKSLWLSEYKKFIFFCPLNPIFTPGNNKKNSVAGPEP
jgi:hypothetical protein